MLWKCDLFTCDSVSRCLSVKNRIPFDDFYYYKQQLILLQLKDKERKRRGGGLTFPVCLVTPECGAVHLFNQENYLLHLSATL